MGEIRGYAGGVDDIVQGEFVNQRAGLEEERQRLQTSCQPPQQAEECKFRQMCTWPMPPEAPRTTAVRVRYLKSVRVGVRLSAVPALTMIRKRLLCKVRKFTVAENLLILKGKGQNDTCLYVRVGGLIKRLRCFQKSRMRCLAGKRVDGGNLHVLYFTLHDNVRVREGGVYVATPTSPRGRTPGEKADFNSNILLEYFVNVLEPLYS